MNETSAILDTDRFKDASFDFAGVAVDDFCDFFCGVRSCLLLLYRST